MGRPNIVLFLMDTQRFDNMSCYGYSKKTTPSIDRIADEGAIFLNHITAGVWTLPSHASLFTGRYVSGHGADANFEYLAVEFLTIAEILNDLGYQTIGFSNNGWVSRKTGIARGFQEFYMISRLIKGRKVVEWFYISESFEKPEEQDKGSLKTINAAISWLEKKWDRSKPFFMFINCIEPHGPYRPPEPFRSRFLPKDVTEEELKTLPPLNSTREAIDIRIGVLKLTERQWFIQKALYDGSTATLDDRIGRFYQYLEEKGLADNTIIIITSDHGDVHNEHPPHVEHHLCAYEELIHIPLIIRYPEIIPKNTKIKWLSQNVDILPTILDILGVKEGKYWKTIQGVSLLPTITRNKPVREYALTEYNSLQMVAYTWARHPDFHVGKFYYRLKAIRNMKYKYIWYSNGIEELYDLENDPKEIKNLANEKTDIVKKMRLELEKILLSIDIIDYGDKQWIEERYKTIGEQKAKEVYTRLKIWGFYRELKPAILPKEEDIVI